MLPVLVLGTAVFFGLAFGSFLNVCIVRLPRDESVVRPRSHCMACGATLRNRDNIPLVGYALLRGRCRDCGAAISPQYPLVEAATAAWFALSFAPLAAALWEFSAPSLAGNVDAVFLAAVHGAAVAVFGFLLIGLAVMDWQTGLLPNEFTLGGLAAGVFFTFAESFFVPPVATKTLFTPEEAFIAHRLLAAAIGFLLLWAIGAVYRVVRRRPGIGMGDAKLLSMMGCFLGLAPLAVAFLAGTALAALAAAVVLLTRRGNGSTRLPFGTFLAAGGMLAALTGARIANAYLAFFR